MTTKNGTLVKVIISVVSLAITIGATATITIYVRAADTDKELGKESSTVAGRVGVLEERVRGHKAMIDGWRTGHETDINRRLDEFGKRMDSFSRQIQNMEAGQAAILTELGKIKGKL